MRVTILWSERVHYISHIEVDPEIVAITLGIDASTELTPGDIEDYLVNVPQDWHEHVNPESDTDWTEDRTLDAAFEEERP